MKQEGSKVLVESNSFGEVVLEALEMAAQDGWKWQILVNGSLILSKGDRSVQFFQSSLGKKLDQPFVFTVKKDGENTVIEDDHVFDGDVIREFLAY